MSTAQVSGEVVLEIKIYKKQKFWFSGNENMLSAKKKSKKWAFFFPDAPTLILLFFLLILSIVIVNADACDLFLIERVNMHWLNAIENQLLFIPHLHFCFLLIPEFSNCHFCFRCLRYRKI